MFLYQKGFDFEAHNLCFELFSERVNAALSIHNYIFCSYLRGGALSRPRQLKSQLSRFKADSTPWCKLWANPTLRLCVSYYGVSGSSMKSLSELICRVTLHRSKLNSRIPHVRLAHDKLYVASFPRVHRESRWM